MSKNNLDFLKTANKNTKIHEICVLCMKLLLTKGSDLNQQQNVEMIALFHAYFFFAEDCL